MIRKYFKVVYEFDPKKDYGFEIRKQFAKCLSVLKKDELINPEEFTKQHLNEFTLTQKPFKTNREAVYNSFRIGKQIGMLEELAKTELGIYITYEKFCTLETISYFKEQLRGSRYKNLELKRDAGTASCYTYSLWRFNNWIHGKTFEFHMEVQQGQDTYKRIVQQVTIDSVEQFLKMYQKPYRVESDYIKVIKKYLLDPIHNGKMAGTIKIDYNAIKSYFEKNDSHINIRFDPKTKYKIADDEDEQFGLSIKDLLDLLTLGQPNITQRGVFLCKFHRGLDTSTFVDRFNFQAWEQLVEYFGTENYKIWDLSKCPIPIKLTRMKTTTPHIGFLDKDAIEAIQKYLDYRYKKTQSSIQKGQALFLNEKNRPINNDWIQMSLRKLARNAGLDKKLESYTYARYKINAHEFRDLLKSTLIDAGVRYDLADHFIGHKFKDSYEKQDVLYPETLKAEYSKVSSRVNIFSNFANYVKGFRDTNELKEEVSLLRKQQIETQKAMLAILQQKGTIP